MPRDRRTGRWRTPPQEVNSLGDLLSGPNLRGAPTLDDFKIGGGFGMWGQRAPTYNYAGLYSAKKQYRQEFRKAGLNYLEDKLNKYDQRMDDLFADASEGYDDIMEQMRVEMDSNDKLREQYEELYMPLRESFVQAAREGVQADTTGAMSQAEAGIQRQFDMARQEQTRDLARYGMNPSDGRFVSGDRAMRIAEAAARGTARTQAYRDESRRAEDENFRRLAAGVSTAPDPTKFNNQGVLAAMSGLQQAQANNNLAQAAYAAKASAGVGKMMSQFNSNQGGGNKLQRINGILVG